MTNLLLLDRQGLTEQWATEPSDHKYREGVWGVCVQISFKTDSFSSKWKYFSAVYSAAALLLSAVPTPVSRTFFFFFCNTAEELSKSMVMLSAWAAHPTVKENEQNIWISQRVWGGGSHFSQVWNQEETWKRGEWLFVFGFFTGSNKIRG